MGACGRAASNLRYVHLPHERDDFRLTLVGHTTESRWGAIWRAHYVSAALETAAAVRAPYTSVDSFG